MTLHHAVHRCAALRGSADTQRIEASIAGVRVALHADFAPLAAYAAQHLAPVRGREPGRAEIVSDLTWVEGPPPRDADAVFPGTSTLQRVDRDVYRGETRLVWIRIDDFRSLKLRFVLEPGRLRVSGRYYFHLSNDPGGDRLPRVVYHARLAAERRRAFPTLLYYLVYYPALWWLETRRGIHPLHGGAVATARGGVLLAGLGAVGKSTLTLGLLALDDTRFLSDTFVLHDRSRLYPMVEPVLLDARSQSWLGDVTRHLREVPAPYDHGYGRRGYHVDTARHSAGAPLALVLLPHRAGTHAVRPVGADECLARMTAANHVPRDLVRYWVFSAVLNLLDAHAGLVESRQDDLAALLDGVPCYEFGVPVAAARATLLERVVSLVSRIDEHAGGFRRRALQT